MVVAFHFQAADKTYGFAWVHSIQQTLFRSLLDSTSGDIHAEVFTGDLLTAHYATDEAVRERILEALLGYNPRKWRTVDHEEFATALFSTRIYVVAVYGLSRKLQDYVDDRFKRNSAYLGAIEIDPANRVHWVLYKQSLIPRYRYVNGEIRIFYRKFEEVEGADAKDTGTAEDLRRAGFRVTFEDTGARNTIFDRYQSFEHSARLADLEAYLSGHLTRISDEILLRLSASDPRLKDTLYTALKSFERIETADDIAQIAATCRRFLEGLANMLYSPRDELVQGRRVSAAEHRNRLWAYVEEKLRGDEKRLALAQLADVGHRIDAIERVSNKGLHDRISRLDVHRLIVMLLVLTYDLLSMTTPPLQASPEPYADEIDGIARDILAKHSNIRETDE